METQHIPFHSDNFIDNYKQIASSLLEIEAKFGSFGQPNKATYEIFRINSASVPTEVLESYFEDLLNLNITDDMLFINKKTLLPIKNTTIITLLSLFIALSLGLISATYNAPLWFSLTITLGLSLPIMILWHTFSKNNAIRRIYFAQIVLQEISQRRGTNGQLNIFLPNQNKLINAISSNKPTIQGAAKKIIQ